MQSSTNAQCRTLIQHPRGRHPQNLSVDRGRGGLRIRILSGSLNLVSGQRLLQSSRGDQREKGVAAPHQLVADEDLGHGGVLCELDSSLDRGVRGPVSVDVDAAEGDPELGQLGLGDAAELASCSEAGEREREAEGGRTDSGVDLDLAHGEQAADEGRRRRLAEGQQAESREPGRKTEQRHEQRPGRRAAEEACRHETSPLPSCG